MGETHFNRRGSKPSGRVARILIRLLSILALLAVVAFLFLRLYGVPAPVLREIISRANAAGIRVDIEGIRLTLRGWRAGNVSYYSACPDDLVPIFRAEQVYFSRGTKRKRDDSKGWRLNVEAEDIHINPPGKWGIHIPEHHPVRKIDYMETTLSFQADRIEVSDGEIWWLNSKLSGNGVILRKSKERTGRGGRGRVAQRPAETMPTPPSEYMLSAEQFAELETRLKMLVLPNGAEASVTFSIDTENYTQSRFDFSVAADNPYLRGVDFSRIELSGAYAYPVITVDRAEVKKGNRSAKLSATYDHVSGQLQGALQNSIISKQLLLLAPNKLLSRLSLAGIGIRQIPRLNVTFGPDSVSNMLNHVSGNFAIKSIAYTGLTIESMQGQFSRAEGRTEFKDLSGVVKGQEFRAAESGSAMQGGPVSGSAYWDGNAREFGILATTAIDPSLLIPPLSISRIATNVLQRFSFHSRPPKLQLEIKSNVTDWSSFYLRIDATGNDLAFQGVGLSSLNTSAEYQHKVLRLDPLAATQDGKFAKGSVAIDFGKSSAQFDLLTTIHPADFEDILCPRLGLFGEKLSSTGEVRIDAQGSFDWGSMDSTDFIANIKAEKFVLPVASTDGFTAEVKGHGKQIAVTDARFGLYGGEGTGAFSIEWDPLRKQLPCSFETDIAHVNLKEFRQFLAKGKPVKVSGTMTGRLAMTTDLSTNILAVANGEGFVRVDDGQLTDLPLFNGFSRLVRKIIPGFSVFSITNLRGTYRISDGNISSGDAYFEGDVISAKGKGKYHYQDGFDAKLQVQIFRESKFSKVVRAITDPLMRLLKIRLEGPLSDPSWKLYNF